MIFRDKIRRLKTEKKNQKRKRIKGSIKERPTEIEMKSENKIQAWNKIRKEISKKTGTFVLHLERK